MAKRFTVSALLTAQDRASRDVQQVETRFSRLGRVLRTGLVAAAGAATAALAALTAAISKGVAAAQVQEDAIARLDAALSPLGDRAREVSQDLQAYAAELQRTTKFGDEALIQTQAFLAELGVAPGQIAEATRASADLAEALGVSLQEAARNVGKTVGGFAGELGEVIPELKELSAEALRSGEGITFLADRFEGRAAAAARTFSGRMAQLRNAFGDLLERIGQAITENEVFEASIRRLTEAMQGGGGVVRAVDAFAAALARATSATVEAGQGVADFVRGLSGLREVSGPAGVLLKALVDSISAMGSAIGLVLSPLTRFVGAIAELGEQARLAADAEAGLEQQQDRMASAFQESVEAILRQGDALDSTTRAITRLERAQSDAIESSDALNDVIEDLGITLSSQINEELERNRVAMDAANEAYRRGEITLRDFQAIEQAVAEESERLRGSLEGQGAALDRVAPSAERAAQGYERIRDSAAGARGEVERLTRAEEQRQSISDAAAGGLAVLGSQLFTGTDPVTGTATIPREVQEALNARGFPLRAGGAFARPIVRVLPDGTRVFDAIL